MKNVILILFALLLLSCGSKNESAQSAHEYTSSPTLPSAPAPPSLPVQNNLVMPPSSPTVSDNKHSLASENKNSPANENKTKFHIVEVFYGTDRKRSGANDKFKYYGNERNTSNKYEVGTIDVSIPHDHQVGQIEKAPWWKLWNRNDNSKYVLPLGLTPLEYDEFTKKIKKIVDSSDEKDEFVFVHGYNNSFEDAAKRTAQLAFDLGFKGAPIMFSWPSRGTVQGYLADEDAVQWAVPHFKDFLSRLITQTGAKKIHLIAHSMGNRALTNVLMTLQTLHPGVLFDQIILAAPDIDADVFKRDIAPKILTISNRITLYASSKDKALLTSKKIHHDVRAGEGGEYVLVRDSIETIDASNLNSPDFLDHSYFSQSRPLIEDISKLFEFNAPPTKRNLKMQTISSGNYWLFKK